jgi:hypothetical protein
MKLLTLIIFTNLLAISQDTLKPTFYKNKNNTIQISLIGESIVGGSINYERVFFRKNYYNIGAGLGLGLTIGKWNLEYTNPLYLTVNIGKKKHFAKVSFGINNIFNPSPYPKTKAERDAFIANPPLPEDEYQPPYRKFEFISLGYNFIGRNGFLIGADICYTKYYLSCLVPGGFGFLPKIKIGYAF